MKVNVLTFEMVADTSKKQLENSKKIYYGFVGTIDWNIPAVSGAPSTIKGKWRHKIKMLV